MKASKIGPPMESLNADFFQFSAKIIKSLVSSKLARNLSLIGDISEVFPKFTKFPVTIVSGGGSKACFWKSRDHMINESRDSVGEIPSL